MDQVKFSDRMPTEEDFPIWVKTRWDCWEIVDFYDGCSDDYYQYGAVMSLFHIPKTGSWYPIEKPTRKLK